MVHALAQRIPALAPGWRFVFLRHKSRARPIATAPNVTEVILTTALTSPLAGLGLNSVFEREGVDLFHAPANIVPTGIRPNRLITTVHDVMWLNDPALCGTGLWHHIERQFYRAGIRRALRQSDAIATVSEATARDISRVSALYAAKTTAILSGVDPAFRAGSTDRTRVSLLGVEPGRYVLVVGQYAPYKNHAAALRGFAGAFGNRPAMKLIFVQRQGRNILGLKQLAVSLGVENQVAFHPAVETDTLHALYRGALCLLHPSFCEGFGMPLAEAMASGCPVVTSNASAMPEVCGDAALLIDPHDVQSISMALSRIANDPDYAGRLRTRGLARAAELDWDRAAADYLALYRSVLERPGFRAG